MSKQFGNYISYKYMMWREQPQAEEVKSLGKLYREVNLWGSSDLKFKPDCDACV